MCRIYIMYVNIQVFALCKHPTSYILNSCTLHMCMNTYMRRIHVIYTAYMYAFALYKHPASHVSFSRTSNMCMNMYIRRIYIKHIEFVLCKHHASHILYSCMSNMCMNIRMYRIYIIYIIHICVCLVQAPCLSIIILFHVEYV